MPHADPPPRLRLGSALLIAAAGRRHRGLPRPTAGVLLPQGAGIRLGATVVLPRRPGRQDAAVPQLPRAAAEHQPLHVPPLVADAGGAGVEGRRLWLSLWRAAAA